MRIVYSIGQWISACYFVDTSPVERDRVRVTQTLIAVTHSVLLSVLTVCTHSLLRKSNQVVSLSHSPLHTHRFASALSTHARVLLIVAVVRVAATVISRVLVTRERSCPTLTVTVTLLSITHTLSSTWVRKVYITVTHLT